MQFISHKKIPLHNGGLENYIAHCRGVVEKRDYNADEASLCVPDDTGLLHSVLSLAKKKVSNHLKYIIVIGIGGSNLGTKAIYEALRGTADILTGEEYPKMLFLDTTDPEYLAQFSSFFKREIKDSSEIIVSIISKSGGTTETAVNGEFVIQLLKDKFKNWADRCTVISEKGSLLWKNAEELGIDRLENPPKVGGRYSVFSPVGLFPLAMAGVNVQMLVNSAVAMRDRCLRIDENNPALQSAIVLYEAISSGLSINDNFFFHTELESVGKWYRQLMGESTGKKGMGLTPTVSIGSVDLHSVAQLYLGGPKNKITSFVYTDTYTDVKLPIKNSLTHLSEIEGKTAGEIMSAIQKGTVTAYSKLQLPFTETVLEVINEKEIASYLQFKMMEIMYLGNLMGVNAFDQPEVELYKTETKKILAEK